MRKFSTRNMKPVNVMRFGASHVGKNCWKREGNTVDGVLSIRNEAQKLKEHVKHVSVHR